MVEAPVIVRAKDVMRSPPYTVDYDKTGIQALREMEKLNIKKILVLRNDGTPLGVLESWMISKMDEQTPIGNLPLPPPEKVAVDTDISEVQEKLSKHPAVYVHDPHDKNKLIGVITVHDIAKLY